MVVRLLLAGTLHCRILVAGHCGEKHCAMLSLMVALTRNVAGFLFRPTLSFLMFVPRFVGLDVLSTTEHDDRRLVVKYRKSP